MNDMDVYTIMNGTYTVPPDMPVQAARDIITSLVDGMQSVPYIVAVQLFYIAQWEMVGTWIPITYIGMSIEESIRKAQLKNVVHDQDLVYIVTPTTDSVLLNNILSEKIQNIQITTENSWELS